jgi:hypothetical protein
MRYTCNRVSNSKGGNMKSRRLALLVLVLALGAISGKCPKASINPNDSTKPIVTLKVRDKDGQYKEMNEAPLKMDESLEFMCIAEDPEGVKSVRYSYSGGINTCTVGSSVFNGSFSVQPLPPPVEQVLSGNPGSEVLIKLPLLSNPDLKGPFTCTAGSNGTGLPIGQKITLHCNGTNWSSNNQNSGATKTLIVNLK